MRGRPTSCAWIVIPAYNEAKTIFTVVFGLRTAGYENICVVSDGSADDTATLAFHAGSTRARAYRQPGSGRRTANRDRLRTCEGCRRHLYVRRGWSALARRRLPACWRVSIGRAQTSRWARDSFRLVPRSRPLRRLLLKAALVFTRIHARVDVTDTHNGLRAFTRRAAEKIRIEQPQMAHASEILQKIGAEQLAFVEVPVRVDYTKYSRKKGQSGFDSVKILLDLLYRSIALRH